MAFLPSLRVVFIHQIEITRIKLPNKSIEYIAGFIDPYLEKIFQASWDVMEVPIISRVSNKQKIIKGSV